MRIEIEPKTTVVVGVGNRLCRDDGVGPLLIDRLQGWPGVLLDAGGAPADYAEELIARGSVQQVLIVDCAGLGLEPGEFRLVEADRIESGTITTHRIPIHLFVELMRQLGNCQVDIIGVQPADTGIGTGLTAAVAGSLEKLARMIETGDIDVEPLI